jgi:asparagine synthase (glutamine-hydrolysing)
LTAWEKLGDQIWPILRGPFAAAIWDPKQGSLTLARDHLGLNVVMWHKNDRFFAFATMPKGLFALPNVPRELSEEKFADFLVLNHADHTNTIYQGIFRIPPSHFAKVRINGVFEQHRYWSPADIKQIRFSSNQKYADGMRECLDQAVRRQLRSAHPIGCYLTGGLDSSSVAALAARALDEKAERLAAFTQVPRQGFDGPVPKGYYADETPYVEAIRSTIKNIDVTYVRNNECDDFAELERFFLVSEAPVRNPSNLGWMLAIPRLARAQGRRVLLGGLYGNYTISWDGWSQTIDHFLSGRWPTAYYQWRIFYSRSSYSRWAALNKLILEPLMPDRTANWIDRLVRSNNMAPWQHHSAIRSEFAQAMGVNARATKFGHDFLYRTRRGERSSGLTQLDYIGDWLAAEKAYSGVEARNPTADIDVVHYSLGVPPEQYLVERIDRSLIRRAMWGLLPDIVLTNRSSGLQSADWYEKLESRRDQLASEISALSASPKIQRAIDLARLGQAIQDFPTCDWHTKEVIEEYQLALTRGIAASRFLRWVHGANR